MNRLSTLRRVCDCTELGGLVAYLVPSSVQALLLKALGSIKNNIMLRTFLLLAGLSGLFYLIKNRWYWIIYKTFKRDLNAAIRFVHMNYYLIQYQLRNQTVPKIFRNVWKRQPHKVAFYFEDDIWTFKQVEEQSNRVGNYFLNLGYKRGDRVALFLENRPEYVCMWLGLNKIGVITALINTNLTLNPLSHSIQAAKSKGIIFGSEYSNAVKGIYDSINDLDKFQYHETTKSDKPLLDGAKDLRTALQNSSTEPLDGEIEKGNLRDQLLYIYTSGTTGLPKAATITNVRLMLMAVGMNSMAVLKDNECVYDPLPLYHSAGGLLGIGQAILCGSTVAIRKKFSASNFWSDCAKYRCTIGLYIGEICRYILAAKQEKPVKHHVRAMFGNGLKPQIWTAFAQKFGIKEIFEFYGATEGNSNLVNIDSKVGAVGFIPRYARWLYPLELIKCDKTGEPIRDENGFCIQSEINEPGILIGQISKRKAVNQFSGYADKAATEKKIMRNVFKKGDEYFNSGDILIRDELGYYYFKDRTGDTYRWKGENVSTSEVEAVISNILQLNDAVVFGVQIPGTEGRAGMAAIVDTEKNTDIEKLTAGLKLGLPTYAQPLFIRLIESVQLTGTYKLIKKDLQQDGFDVTKTADKIYFYDAHQKKYVILTNEIYDDIQSGKLRL
nr:long-chain fatty acid transport protein 1 [Onthophagus taurus]